MASVIAGTRVRGKNCWSTQAQAEAEAARLATAGGCKPVLYSIQFHNDTGKDGKTPDVGNDEPTGKADMNYWDAENPNGTYYNFGTIVGPDSVAIADNMHNPDRDGDGKGDHEPKAPIMEMTVVVESLDAFTALMRNGLFNAQVWCVLCKGNYK